MAPALQYRRSGKRHYSLTASQPLAFGWNSDEAPSSISEKSRKNSTNIERGCELRAQGLHMRSGHVEHASRLVGRHTDQDQDSNQHLRHRLPHMAHDCWPMTASASVDVLR